MQTDRSKWSGEGTFTALLVERLQQIAGVDVVRVEWPSKIVQQLSHVSVRQFLTLVEPSASIQPAALNAP